MKKNLSRKDFIKLTALGITGFYISSCNLSEDKKEDTEEKDTSTEKIPEPITISEDDVIFYKKEDANYEKLRGGFNKRVQKYPLVIAQCKTQNGIAAAVKYAKENKLAVSIKSGGHCFEGFSSNDNGLVINLSLMNKVSFLENDLLSVQPGCTLSQLYDTILPKGKIIPAGSCGGVGVGGLTLGGGYGFFSRKYGLTCDSLQSLTLIDGNGDIHSSNDKPDLLWACKGGGNGNFGVVSELIFKTHNTPAHFTSHRFKALKVDAARVQTILEQWFILTKDLPQSCFAAFVHNGKTLNILLTDYENNAATVEQFKNILTSLVDKVTIGTPKLLASSLKNYYGIQHPLYFKNSSAGLYENYATIQPFIKEVLQKVIDTPGMIYQINTLGGNINNADFEKASAYPHRSLPYLSELQTYWDLESQTKKYETAFEEVQTIFRNNNIQTQYRNYPDINFKDWSNAYYGDNYERLQRIKKEFDAENIFRFEQSVKLDSKGS